MADPDPGRDDIAETAPRRPAPDPPVRVAQPRPPGPAVAGARPGRRRAAGAVLLVSAGLAALVAVPRWSGDDRRQRSGVIAPISRRPLAPVAVPGPSRAPDRSLPGVVGDKIVLGGPAPAARNWAGLAAASGLAGAG